MKLRKWMAAGLISVVLAAASVPSYIASAAPADGVEVSEGKKEIVLVIDPGHGGSNTGGQIPGLMEKDITLITALAMKEELEKYEGIRVILTRSGDEELSLYDRPKIAKDAGADLFISLHYNKAVPNRLYGAEVWIPSLGENYARAYACGDLILNELCDGYGLYRRGVKTKVGSSGKDYYGVIKYASEFGIPSMIVEHCHLDNEEDVPFFNSPEKLVMLGKLDATGVAKYFGLSSKLLGVDYSHVAKTNVAPPLTPVVQDITPPETAAVVSASLENGQIRAVLQGSDRQSGIYYYDYSLDGGLSWSPLQRWDSVETTDTVTIPGSAQTLTIRVYNQYDLAAQSLTAAVSKGSG